MAQRPGRVSFPSLLGQTTQQYATLLEQAENAGQRLMEQVLYDLALLLERVPELGRYLELSADAYKLVEPQEEHGDETGTD